MSYSILIFEGNLTRDPDMSYTPQGTAVTRFGVALNNPRDNSTAWFNVTAFGRTAENCNQYLTKGAPVIVEGRLEWDPETGCPRLWQDSQGFARSSFDVAARTVTFLPNPARQTQGQYQPQGQPQRQVPQGQTQRPAAPQRQAPQRQAPQRPAAPPPNPYDDVPF